MKLRCLATTSEKGPSSDPASRRLEREKTGELGMAKRMMAVAYLSPNGASQKGLSMLAAAIEPEILRMVERLIVVLMGGMSLTFGYRLFREGVVLDQEGEIKLLGSFHLKALRLGPGIFFAAFGCFILCLSLYKGIVTNGFVGVKEPMHRSSARFSGIGAQASFKPEQCIAALNTLSDDMTDAVDDYFRTESGKKLFAAIRHARIHLLFDAFPQDANLVKRFLQANEAGQALAELTSDADELERFQAIESTYTALMD